ncbi:hypothetical protein PybrP1_010665 [[Pythium] brassicae (nom. inval.)]|nr:hypothetical protein PybrP1_010665 [[Pythium] brassicae (nom. inval.)]
MSGSGRKSAYRKGVTDKVLYDAPEPKENEQIVRVVGLRGGNLFEVADALGTRSLTLLPAKFRKLIWIKRGDFLIVASSDEAATGKKKKKTAVSSNVEHILYKDQIKHLKSANLWPEAFDKQEETAAASAADEGGDSEDTAAEASEVPVVVVAAVDAQKSNGITMLDMSFADLNVNRNRRQNMFAEDEAEEEDEDSD